MVHQPIDQMLRQLREELARIDYLIRILESMAEGKRRRGRPPKLAATFRDKRRSHVADKRPRS